MHNEALARRGYQGCALRKISGSPLGSQPFQLGFPGLQVGHLSRSDEEVFCTHTNLTGLLITKLGNFSFWVGQKTRMLSYETHQSFHAIQI